MKFRILYSRLCSSRRFYTWNWDWVVSSQKMHNISWDAEMNRAVTRMDRFGIIILVVYLIFSISRRWIFGHWLQGYGLTAFSLSVGAGGMLGRLYTTRQKIRQVLKEEGVLRSRTSKK